MLLATYYPHSYTSAIHDTIHHSKNVYCALFRNNKLLTYNCDPDSSLAFEFLQHR